MEILAEQVKEILSKFDCPQNTFAELVGREETQLSRKINGFANITKRDKPRFALAIQFLTALRASTPAPICFHSFQKLKPLWTEFQRASKQSRAAAG